MNQVVSLLLLLLRPVASASLANFNRPFPRVLGVFVLLVYVRSYRICLICISFHFYRNDFDLFCYIYICSRELNGKDGEGGHNEDANNQVSSEPNVLHTCIWLLASGLMSVVLFIILIPCTL